jgi:hypothetical protein
MVAVLAVSLAWQYWQQPSSLIQRFLFVSLVPNEGMDLLCLERTYPESMRMVLGSFQEELTDLTARKSWYWMTSAFPLITSVMARIQSER